MSRQRRDLTADERKLWRRVVATTKPRRAVEAEAPAPDSNEPKREIAAGRPSPIARTVVVSRKAAAPPADRGAEKRVRRGKVEIEASLDLHGYTQDAAFTVLATFIAQSRRRGARTVLVITGSGRGGEGVLKRRLPDWLGGPELRPHLAGYAQAHRQHGGGGAFYLFLKRADAQR